MNQEQARKHIKKLKEFYSHLATYVSVNTFLLILNLWTSPDFLWVLFPLGGWGIGLAIHAFEVFGTSGNWEERKMQELTGWQDTQDELERLSERTENLVTILSSINWEKIDPEFLDTRDNLEEAQKNLVRLQSQLDGDSNVNKNEVVREIEKLEEFVTSPKFKFLDTAQR